MKTTCLSFFLVLIAVCLGTGGSAASQDGADLACSRCHSCEKPTRMDPCLFVCQRNAPSSIHRSAEEGPEVITIDELSSRYAPVEFTHRLHAAMSEFSGGCALCHHHEIGGEISACGNCHPSVVQGADLGQPSLKGAYHRQCLGCHREWSHSTACSVCHVLRDGSGGAETTTDVAHETEPVIDTTDIVGIDHPPIEEPGRVLYETAADAGTYVTFYHDDHVERFDLACVSCHQQESCSRCHDAAVGKERPAPLPADAAEERDFEDAHASCINCHEESDCESCHQAGPRAPFDHALSWGWPLDPYHENRACRDCHGAFERFRKPDRSCDGCHAGWQAGTFDHAVTGLTLDETHLDMDCEMCHLDRDFSVDPGCEDCHDDRGYPDDRPGTVADPKRSR